MSIGANEESVEQTKTMKVTIIPRNDGYSIEYSADCINDISIDRMEILKNQYPYNYYEAALGLLVPYIESECKKSITRNNNINHLEGTLGGIFKVEYEYKDGESVFDKKLVYDNDFVPMHFLRVSFLLADDMQCEIKYLYRDDPRILNEFVKCLHDMYLNNINSSIVLKEQLK